MLVAYKYTSNQRAVKRARDDISANLLTLKLFKDNTPAVLRRRAVCFWARAGCSSSRSYRRRSCSCR